MRKPMIALFLGMTLTACGPDMPSSAAETSAGSVDSIYRQAVDHLGRTEEDRARDAGRKPAEVLEFAGIRPGMKILDMYSGGGYYTEILSRIVGPEGSVTAHTNQAYAQFVGEEATNRYAGSRLANVEHLMAENNELSLPREAFDAVMLILAYHDIYYVDPENGWARIDGRKFVAELYEGTKPGGMLVVVDHYAAPGSPPDTGNTLHRIDPAIVIEEIEAAGFTLEARSDVLRNPEDDHSLPMGDPQVRGKTDRFVLKFRKPG